MYDYFYVIYYNAFFLLFIMQAIRVSSVRSGLAIDDEQYKFRINLPIVAFLILFSLIAGGRPGDALFGDTKLYQAYYEDRYLGYDKEVAFNALTELCLLLKLPTDIYLSVIFFLYVFLPYLFICKFTRNQWLALLFYFGAFSFLGYGLNGIRNGLALSIVIFLFSFLTEEGKPQWLFFVPLSLFAIGVHKSAVLPVGCLLLSCYYVKDIKTAITIWFMAIPVSFLAGSSISNLFLGLGYDERLDEYLSIASTHGFRWDFILYSIVPIALAVYIETRNIPVDRLYSVLINTYILANALWIMVIRANFSNRFAYLSWFLYPIVIAYPLLKFKIWKNQNKVTAFIMIGYYAFTYYMYLIGK